jgi:sulfate/thiosulfate transport system permease protein
VTGGAGSVAAGRLRLPRVGGALGIGLATAYMSLIVLLPMAAVFGRSLEDGAATFWDAITAPQSVAALKLTLVAALIVTLINAVMGTALAWVLVRDRFPGRRLVDAIIDLPFALPTIVAGLTLLALYGPSGPVGINVAFTQTAVCLALLFVTLPFVVRAVEPVLKELDPEMEEAAASLGAGRLAVFARVILPQLWPAILTGVGLAFSRALGEFGSVVLISGNIPFDTEVSSVNIFGLIENDRPGDAAAVSVLLLAVSLVLLIALSIVARLVGRHARADRAS